MWIPLITHDAICVTCHDNDAHRIPCHVMLCYAGLRLENERETKEVERKKGIDEILEGLT